MFCPKCGAPADPGGTCGKCGFVYIVMGAVPSEKKEEEPVKKTSVGGKLVLFLIVMLIVGAIVFHVVTTNPNCKDAESTVSDFLTGIQENDGLAVIEAMNEDVMYEWGASKCSDPYSLASQLGYSDGRAYLEYRMSGEIDQIYTQTNNADFKFSIRFSLPMMSWNLESYEAEFIDRWGIDDSGREIKAEDGYYVYVKLTSDDKAVKKYLNDKGYDCIPVLKINGEWCVPSWTNF